jgi:tartrate dehydrogenase/decarboxylase/D-malate dehydrogenase
MLLDHLGHPDVGAAVVAAIEAVLTDGPRTRDLGGSATTEEVGRAIASAL